MINRSFTKKEVELLRGILGKKLQYYCCDPFEFNNVVYKYFGVFVEDKTILFSNEMENVDYYGMDEEICFLRVNVISEEKWHSGLENVKQIKVPLNKTIHSIRVIEEKQKLLEDKKVKYEYCFVRKVIFVFEDKYELALEKTDAFSEEIAITRGVDLSAHCLTDIDKDDFDEKYQFEMEQAIVELQ